MFFIDHKHKITTFIDPRLPLPDTVFTYTTRAASASAISQRRSALYNEETELRSHHVTTVRHSTSDDTITSTSSMEPTTPTLEESGLEGSEATTSNNEPPS